jgi:hypothetical protein
VLSISCSPERLFRKNPREGFDSNSKYSSFCNKTENTAKNCCQNYAKNVMLRRSFVIIPVSNFYEDNISKKKKNIHPAI